MYTPLHPEPKRTWDERPTLPRKRPHEFVEPPTRTPLPRKRCLQPLPRLRRPLQRLRRVAGTGSIASAASAAASSRSASLVVKEGHGQSKGHREGDRRTPKNAHNSTLRKMSDKEIRSMRRAQKAATKAFNKMKEDREKKSNAAVGSTVAEPVDYNRGPGAEAESCAKGSRKGSIRESFAKSGRSDHALPGGTAGGDPPGTAATEPVQDDIMLQRQQQLMAMQQYASRRRSQIREQALLIQQQAMTSDTNTGTNPASTDAASAATAASTAETAPASSAYVKGWTACGHQSSLVLCCDHMSSGRPHSILSLPQRSLIANCLVQEELCTPYNLRSFLIRSPAGLALPARLALEAFALISKLCFSHERLQHWTYAFYDLFYWLLMQLVHALYSLGSHLFIHFCSIWTTTLFFDEPPGPKSRNDPPTRTRRLFVSSPKLVWFRFLLFYFAINGVVGARVASDATGAGSQEPSATVTSGGSLTTRHGKRAFHRAQQRAQALGGTFYKGRWCTAKSLNTHGPTDSFPSASSTPQPRKGAFRSTQTNHHSRSINFISWNSSGLGSGVLPEFLLWIDMLPASSRPHVILIQESHWRFTSEYRHGDWLAFHNGVSESSQDRYAGLVTLVRIPGVTQDHVRVHNILQGRLTHVRVDLPHRNLDIIHVYQHPLTTDPSKTTQDKRRRLFQRPDAVVQSMPGRNFLAVGGDFNIALPFSPPHTGSSLMTPYPIQPEHTVTNNALLRILERHSLQACHSAMAEPAIFRLPDPGDGELEDRESESEAEEARRSAGALRTVRYRDRLRNASRAQVLFLYAKTCGDESESLGTAAAGNYLFCVAELGGKCIKPLDAQEHLQHQDSWRARRQKRRDRDFAAKQMSLQNQTTRNQMLKCCLKSLFRFRAAVQLGPAQAAVAGAWCRAPAAANQGAVTPVPAMPALAGRLAVLPAGQAQWVFQAAAQSVIFEAVADRQGLYTCFAAGQAAEPEVGTARRYLGRPFWMVRLPPTVMKHLMEIGKEFVVPAGLVTSLGHQLPGTVPAAAEGSPCDGADSGSSSSSEMKKVRRPAMQEILLGKLAYKLSSTVGIQDVLRTVLRMLVPDSLGPADNMNVSRGHVRNILLKLDALHSLSRRFLAPPGGGADKSLRIVRYISPDSSPQANYDYFCATEELLLYRSDELPRDADGNVAPFKGFEHQRRSMLCTTIARGQGSTASKASKMVHMIAVESGASLFETYRSEVRGFLSDQGTERGIASFPVRSCSEVQSIVGTQALASEAIQEDFRGLPLFHSALHIPGTLHIVFNALEFSLKQLETWPKFEKQLNSITRVCKEKSYSEVILVRMMKHASPEERRLLHRMDELLDWRWDSLARVLKVWVPLYPTFKKYWNPAVFGGDSSSVTIRAVTEALADECHFDMAVWTHQFSAEATRLAHFFEGCHCHQEQLTDPENWEKINCCWKGRRLPWLAQKLAYAQQVPWVFAAAFAGYMGETWGRVKKVLRPHLQNVDNMISSGQVGLLDSVTHALFGPTDTGRMLREFLNSEDDVPLDRWPALFWKVQEYAFVSLSERHTEREHVGVKVAANRGLTKAGPAVVCSRKRRDQVLEMLEDEKQLAFLVTNWRSRRLWSSLLEHMLTHEEVRLMETPKRLSRLCGYSEEDHFKDCEDSVRADAVYRQALRDQTLLLAGSFKLPSASYQVVNWLKGHLATGVFFSVSTHVFELLVDRGRRCEDPAASFRTDVLLSILRADVHPRVSDRASVFCSVLDARPEARTDARGVHGLGGDVRVACTNVRIEVLDLARVCTAENLKAFCANCLLWRAMPAELALALGDESTQPGLLQEPQVQKLPEIVLDSDPASLLSRPPPDRHVEDALDILHPPAHVVQNADDSAVLQVYGAPCSDREMQAIKELLRARAIGIESAVYATDLEHFDAVALEGLRGRGLVICETDMFSDVSVALTGKLTYSASLVLARPLLLWELDQTTLTRGQMPGRSKLELIRLLFVLGWEPGLGREAWHRKQGEKRLPDDVLVCSLPFLRALMLSRLIWEKPGNLSGIYLKGPQQYYEFLVDQDDLSSLRDASAEEINARFAQKKKRPAGRILTRDAATGLELDPEADDAELEELVQELPEKLMQAEEPQPSMASGARRVAPLEIDLGGGRAQVVHFDNFTHSSGQLRGFAACETHIFPDYKMLPPCVCSLSSRSMFVDARNGHTCTDTQKYFFPEAFRFPQDTACIMGRARPKLFVCRVYFCAID
ncbi:unnamed protein product [Symbiodinium sp. CCMP2592]|nr:unnamed protein product [Symbiodinium sp. CCMP2592]